VSQTSKASKAVRVRLRVLVLVAVRPLSAVTVLALSAVLAVLVTMSAHSLVVQHYSKVRVVVAAVTLRAVRLVHRWVMLAARVLAQVKRQRRTLRQVVAVAVTQPLAVTALQESYM